MFKKIFKPKKPSSSKSDNGEEWEPNFDAPPFEYSDTIRRSEETVVEDGSRKRSMEDIRITCKNSNHKSNNRPPFELVDDLEIKQVPRHSVEGSMSRKPSKSKDKTNFKAKRPKTEENFKGCLEQSFNPFENNSLKKSKSFAFGSPLSPTLTFRIPRNKSVHFADHADKKEDTDISLDYSDEQEAGKEVRAEVKSSLTGIFDQVVVPEDKFSVDDDTETIKDESPLETDKENYLEEFDYEEYNDNDLDQPEEFSKKESPEEQQLPKEDACELSAIEKQYYCILKAHVDMEPPSSSEDLLLAFKCILTDNSEEIQFFKSELEESKTREKKAHLELDDKTGALKEQDEVLMSRDKEMGTLMEKLNKSKLEVDTLRSQKTEPKIPESDELKEKLEHELMNEKLVTTELKEKCQLLHQEKINIDESLSIEKTRASELKNSFHILEQERQKLKSENTTLKEREITARKENSIKVQEIESLKANDLRAAALEENIVTLKDHISDHKSTIHELKDKIKTLEEERNKLSEISKAQLKELYALKDDTRIAQTKYQQSSEALEAIKEKLIEVTENLETLQKTRVLDATKNEKLDEEIKVLREANRNITENLLITRKALESAKEELKASRASNITQQETLHTEIEGLLAHLGELREMGNEHLHVIKKQPEVEIIKKEFEDLSWSNQFLAENIKAFLGDGFQAISCLLEKESHDQFQQHLFEFSRIDTFKSRDRALWNYLAAYLLNGIRDLIKAQKYLEGALEAEIGCREKYQKDTLDMMSKMAQMMNEKKRRRFK